MLSGNGKVPGDLWLVEYDNGKGACWEGKPFDPTTALVAAPLVLLRLLLAVKLDDPGPDLDAAELP